MASLESLDDVVARCEAAVVDLATVADMDRENVAAVCAGLDKLANAVTCLAGALAVVDERLEAIERKLGS